MHNESSVISSRRRNTLVGVVLLIGLSGVITFTMQEWVGQATLYRADLEPHRERLHRAILYNAPPPDSTWAQIGANATNIRVGSVYLAEAIHRIAGISVMRVYRLIDTVALFVALPLLFLLQRRWASPEHALVAVLYVAAILPLTYFLHYFHPWDRLMLVAWIVTIGLVWDDRPVLLGAVLLVSMVVKYDLLFFPALYFLVYARRDNLPRVAARTAALFAITFGVYMALQTIFPGGMERADVVAQVTANLAMIARFNLTYPPLLAFAVPALLVLVGWRRTDRFARACVVFGLGLFAIYFTNSFFVELRSTVSVLLLLLPAALEGLRVVLKPVPASEQPAQPLEPSTSAPRYERRVPSRWLSADEDGVRIGDN